MAGWQPHMDRRDALATLGAGLALAPGGAAAVANAGSQATGGSPASDSVLWYAQPAASWVEALPVGAGRIGAMVHGGTTREYLQLNEDTLWSGGPYDPASPDARDALPTARELIFAGRFAEAETLLSEKVMARPLKQMPYGTVGWLVLTRLGSVPGPPPFSAERAIRSVVTPSVPPMPLPGYRRELDLDSAVATTSWTADDGTIHRQDVLASHPHQVIAVRITADRPGAVSLALAFVSPNKDAAVAAGRAGELMLSGANAPAQGVAGALTYNARALMQHKGGTLRQEGDQLIVTGADEVVLLVAMATSYRRYDDVSGDPAAITATQIDRARPLGWRRIAEDSSADHRALFRRVSLDLGRTPHADLPTDQRVRRGGAGDDPSLAALYFNYARYLLIGSSRPGSQPANLQGIWNDSTSPPWGGKYTININTQMNYWPAEPAALPECVEPLVAMLRDLSVTGARTARTMYGARGWVCHHNTDLWRATAPIDAPSYGMWPMGGAWLTTHLWDHYDYGRDRAFLQSVYPIMQGAALFFVDTLVRDPLTGAMVTNPTTSPENRHGGMSALCAGPTMDAGILRDLFTQVADAADILGTDADLARQLRALREELPPFRIGGQGQLQEWQQDWDAQAQDINHRHVSHLYTVYPARQISVETTPDLAKAAMRSLDIRGDEATGWATAWRIALWARLRDGNRAHGILRFLIGPQRTYPNMFDAHPPFQIDGNFGGAAAIAEMLLSSADETILLLPALPDAWPAGSVSGLRARGACTVDLTWRRGAPDSVTLRSTIGGRRIVRFGDVTRALDLAPGQEVRLAGPHLRPA
ncbi:glycoside hydrolase family 95 protein [Croceibacterium sp. TMG7-5b_MA50]|uniref:glycoside hydrolase family 95 protein n=1 Tax=Croceibacterium sp. TMG7-5b_MA50 TaxID=3121290 RepID=UPI003221EC48